MASEVTRRVLGIIGSPRRGGNTDTIVEALLEGAANEGAQVTKISLEELHIASCLSCNHCQRENVCAHNDDMVRLEELMDQSDIWILGTPVYWWSVTGQMKTFIDRWYGFDQRIFGGKEVILVIPMGGSDKVYARHILVMFEAIFNYLGMKHIGTILAAGMTGKDSAKERRSLLDEARSLGKWAVTDTLDINVRPIQIEYPI